MVDCLATPAGHSSDATLNVKRLRCAKLMETVLLTPRSGNNVLPADTRNVSGGSVKYFLKLRNNIIFAASE